MAIRLPIQLLVNVSQFGFEPFACTITGTCKAGVARRQLLQQIDADVRMGMSALASTLLRPCATPRIVGLALATMARFNA
jgi:hypothetical protein